MALRSCDLGWVYVFPLQWQRSFRPRLMASTGNSTTNSDWIELPPSSDQVYNPNLQATSSSQSCSGGAGVKDQEHNSSWGLWNLVQKPLGWVTSGDTSSVDRKDDSVDSVKGASNMAASVPSDQKKGISALIKKAGGAVKKIVRSDDQWEHLDCDKEVKVILNSATFMSSIRCSLHPVGPASP